MNTGRILCKEAVQGEYITVGVEYTFTTWQDGCVEYRRENGAGSYMRKFFWEKAVREGKIVVL